MTLQHGQITDEWLMSYAAGTLSEGQAMMVATHASYHPTLKNKIAEAEAVGGYLLEEESTVEISDTMFDDILSMEDDEAPASDLFAKNDTKGDADLPTCLSSYIGKPVSDLNWRVLGPGLRQKCLWRGEDGEKLWLLKAKPGSVIPMHDHVGLEMTLILRGSYHVDGQQFSVGEIDVEYEGSTDHQPMIDDTVECICLVVTEAPIRIHSLLGRLVQPFIGL